MDKPTAKRRAWRIAALQLDAYLDAPGRDTDADDWGPADLARMRAALDQVRVTLWRMAYDPNQQD